MRSATEFSSWGRALRVSQTPYFISWPTDALPAARGQNLLPYGQGRSYGDSCLNDGGALLVTGALNRVRVFDVERGIFACEAGLTLQQLLEIVVPRGWFPPVVPGTQFVSIGGAIANDIHGKNHHLAGTFGRHVRRFELLRSNGERMLCSPTENADLFSATIGGLGLTGLITCAELQLLPIESPYIARDALRFRGIEEFLQISEQSAKTHAYTVAWLDCLSGGRGIFFRGNHAPATPGARPPKPKRAKTVPCDAPSWLLNSLTVRAFNALYYHQPLSTNQVAYDPFFFPLDSVLHWNRIYGKRGFFQYQCVVPMSAGAPAITELLRWASRSGKTSFLSVLKVFGDVPSPGMLSFPRPGITLTMDFPNHPPTIDKLFPELDRIVASAGGALYPAKDARMSGEFFRQSFPRLAEFRKHVDPRFSSSFWRRVGE